VNITAKKTQHETRLVVSAAIGLHTRPAVMLVKLAQEFNAEIEIALDGKKVNAKSIMGILTLGAEHGAVVKVSAKGEDAEKAIVAITQLFGSNFNEPRIHPVPAETSGSENAMLVLVADDER
jgi:phosphocarrier protein